MTTNPIQFRSNKMSNIGGRLSSRLKTLSSRTKGHYFCPNSSWYRKVTLKTAKVGTMTSSTAPPPLPSTQSNSTATPENSRSFLITLTPTYNSKKTVPDFVESSVIQYFPWFSSFLAPSMSWPPGRFFVLCLQILTSPKSLPPQLFVRSRVSDLHLYPPPSPLPREFSPRCATRTSSRIHSKDDFLGTSSFCLIPIPRLSDRESNGQLQLPSKP